ncbi:lysophospholipid acyltransferase family protein [Piscinibacter sp. XHJ-5]|uniref:lysophospholipid acyltransferase family protein n=1 Tax=Piscinibacter sp. XHJ-5 TaxID=3037797 RepID=UPI0024530743|nr:lysophospholipid acyltransferase family protein [Piscinibacter sp. XHJ-5]
MRSLRAAWRIARAAVHLLHGMLIAALQFPFLDDAQRLARVGWWSAKLLRLLGIALHTQGTPRGGATLVVANHISWLDILAINAVRPVRFVSKADVRHWPLIGWLVACAGTLFIERERKRDALRVVHQVAQALASGKTIAVFPEGTTSDGRGLLPFHANLLQAAISTETPVQPVALRFADAAHEVSVAAAYIGDTTLAQSVWAIVTASGLRAHVTWLPPEAVAHTERRALAELLHLRITHALGVKDCRSTA